MRETKGWWMWLRADSCVRIIFDFLPNICSFPRMNLEEEWNGLEGDLWNHLI